MSTDARFRTKPRSRPLWVRITVGFAVLVIVAVLAIAISVLSGRNNQETMHPDSVAPDGAGALAAVMEDRGLTTTIAHSATAALEAGGTILVWDPDGILTRGQRQSLLDSGNRIIVVSADGRDADDWFSTSYPVTSQPADSPTEATCGLEWLDGITTVEGVTGGLGRDGCFPVGAGSHLVSDANLVYFASPELFVNDNLDRADNAAVAIRALAATDRVTWLRPVAASVDEQAVRAVPPALTGALIGFVLLVLWYGVLVRRPFGPLIAERLPVVVPSAESARGRARLYERGSNTAHAGAALRAGMIAVHAGRLGLPVNASPTSVTSRICQASGWDWEAVQHLLYGPPPASDRELIDLATGLDTLSKELHHD